MRIHRVHLEEDAAKLDPRRRQRPDPRRRRLDRRLQPRRHAARGDRHRARHALAPSRPREWLRLLRATLRQLGVSDVNMEEGSLRCDANVSIRPAGATELGTKTELKNMNSFRFIERGIDAEIARQDGDRRGRRRRSSRRRCTSTRAPRRITSLRSKEEAHDYRYFPEPDLVPIADHRGDARARRAPRCPSCPPPAPSASSASSGLSADERAAAGLPRRAGRLLRGGAGRRRRRRADSRWPTGSPTSSPRRRRRRARPRRRSRPPRWRRSSGWSREGRHPGRRRDRCSTGWSADGGDPAAIVEAEGLGADRRRRRARPDRRGGARGQPRRRREAARRRHEADRRDRRARDEARPRAAPTAGEVTRLVREQLGL